MAIQIALLRGINLGSRNRVAMPELREMCEGLGHADVRTLVQSGNVVLDAKTKPAATAKAIGKALKGELGIEVPVVVRSRAQMRKVVDANPFGEHTGKPKLLLVTFLSEKPAKRVVDGFDPADFEPERFEVAGREVYSWHPGGMQRSKLGRALVDKRLGVVATNRNWNTVTKLVEMAEG